MKIQQVGTSKHNKISFKADPAVSQPKKHQHSEQFIRSRNQIFMISVPLFLTTGSIAYFSIFNRKKLNIIINTVTKPIKRVLKSINKKLSKPNKVFKD